MKKPARQPSVRLIAASLIALTFAAYWRVLENGFIRFLDDGSYVLHNVNIQAGLSAKAISWAFTTLYNANWHPLTWISHILDYSVFGPNPAGYHAVNLILHAANSVLLFLILNRLTRSLWPSAFVAALFAVHPLHVESVAWVAERKDVLSTLFWMLTTGAYVLHLKRPSRWRYSAVVAVFALGLLAKPMLVTLPFTLLLLDYWPLGRLRFGRNGNSIRMVTEKAPLFALSAASCVITYIAQQKGGAVGTFQDFPLGVRMANAAVACVTYIVKMIWPSGLSVLYPHPGTSLPVWEVICSILVVTGISALAIRMARRVPYLAVGWFWYLITLVPVIGIVQVGEQAMADRYTYVPLIGLFVAIAWGFFEGANGRMGEWEKGRSDSPIHPFTHSPILLVAALAVIAALSSLTWIQCGYWRDDRTLFEHALKVTRENATIHGNLGALCAGEGDYARAAEHYSEAVRIRPNAADFRASLGTSLAMTGKLHAAEEQFSQALKLNPKLESVHADLESVRRSLHAASGTDMASFEKAVALFNEGVQLDKQAKTQEAARKYAEAIRLAPNYPDPYCNLARAAYNAGNADEAIRLCRKAINLDPDLGQAHNALAIFLYVRGRYAESWREVHEAERCGSPSSPDFIRLLCSKLADPAK